jgi:hypothetical protein
VFLTATHRGVPYNAQAVAADLHRRRHPNAEFVSSLLTGRHDKEVAAYVDGEISAAELYRRTVARYRPQ